ncbi:MAG: DUF368 domain-containing protein [Phycisphaerales bacterium]|nr:DUF368 domain-containing protein [Phycisphaerales bacterium]
MGLANLVPGVSGGTMLLASGVYRAFVEAVADLTAFRWGLKPLVTLTVIALGAVLAIVAGAGIVRDLVETSRWGMYSVFIGLTLGGIPLVWSLTKPWRPTSVVGCLVGLAAMVVLALLPVGTGDSQGHWVLLLIAGLLGGAAMVLPGLSGAYLLLLLGQYLVVLGAIEALEAGAWSTAATTLIPVGIGAAGGVIGVSNLMRWLLREHPHGTHGVLLGLLAGAVFGLWPFVQPRPPVAGDVIRGSVVTQAQMDNATIEARHWPEATFTPTGGQVCGSLALILAGFAASATLGRLGSGTPSEGDSDAESPSAAS